MLAGNKMHDIVYQIVHERTILSMREDYCQNYLSWEGLYLSW